MDKNRFIKYLNYRNIALGIIALGIIALATWGLKGTHAFYTNNQELQILNATIKIAEKGKGEATPAKVNKSDLVVQIYLQDQADDNKYNLVTHLPAYGYTLNETMSNCTPSKEELSYSDYSLENGVIKFTVKDTGGTNGPKQIVCHIYYDKDINSNITVYALVEDNEFGIKEHNSKKYRFADSNANLSTVVGSAYTYSDAECIADGTTITGYSNGKFSFTTNKPNTCYAYFNEAAK